MTKEKLNLQSQHILVFRLLNLFYIFFALHYVIHVALLNSGIDIYIISVLLFPPVIEAILNFYKIPTALFRRICCSTIVPVYTYYYLVSNLTVLGEAVIIIEAISIVLILVFILDSKIFLFIQILTFILFALYSCFIKCQLSPYIPHSTSIIILTYTLTGVVYFYYKNILFYKNLILNTKEMVKRSEESLLTISHDIRGAINNFFNLSQILYTKWNSLESEKKLELVKKISKNAERLKDLICNLLDFKKSHEHKLEIVASKFDLKSLVDELVKESVELHNLEENEFKIEWVTEPDRVIDTNIEADINLISQCIRNLLSNAIKYKTSLLLLRLKLVNKEICSFAYLEFSIKDSGIGIPVGDLLKIFEPFEQSATTKNRKNSTGLGLSITKKIIELHKGCIFAENNNQIIIHETYLNKAANIITISSKFNKNSINKENGSTFKILLPYKITNQNPEIHYEINTQNTKKNIVIIENEEDVIFALSIGLGNEYNIKSFVSGIEAIEYVKSHYNEISCIILDLFMPDLSGIEIVKIIKSNEYLKNIPIILHTGVIESEEIDQIKALGVSEIISKPASIGKIKSLIEGIS